MVYTVRKCLRESDGSVHVYYLYTEHLLNCHVCAGAAWEQRRFPQRTHNLRRSPTPVKSARQISGDNEIRKMSDNVRRAVAGPTAICKLRGRYTYTWSTTLSTAYNLGYRCTVLSYMLSGNMLGLLDDPPTTYPWKTEKTIVKMPDCSSCRPLRQHRQTHSALELLGSSPF